MISAACWELLELPVSKVMLAGMPAMARNQLTRRRVASTKAVALVPGMQLATTALLPIGTPSEDV
jgi:hypothetical protein